MKKIRIILCALAVIFGVLGANAEFRWGPSVGVNYNKLTFKQTLFTVDNTIGANVGVQGEMMFPGIGFGVDIGGFYSLQGGKLHLGEKKMWAVEGYGTENLMLHYLQIPINLRFKWTRMNGLEEKIAPYVFGGPSINLLVAKSNIKAIEYAGGFLGVQCGVGFELMQRWQIQGQYMWGMTYAFKMAKLTNDSARSGGWQVRVTYLF